MTQIGGARQVVQEHYGRDDISPADIEKAASLEAMTDNDQYCPHGERVVSTVMERGELFDFIRRWRRLFLDTLKPRYLSGKWSVDYDLVTSSSTNSTNSLEGQLNAMQIA
jgi:hypothetical protein